MEEPSSLFQEGEFDVIRIIMAVNERELQTDGPNRLRRIPRTLIKILRTASTFTQICRFMAQKDPSMSPIRSTFTTRRVLPPLQLFCFNVLILSTDHVIHGLSEMGIHLSGDLNTGDPTGAMMVPSSMSPTNQTRSDARTGYFDPAISRPNLHVVTGQTATRLIVGLPGSLAKEGTRRRIMGVDVSLPSVLILWRLEFMATCWPTVCSSHLSPLASTEQSRPEGR